MLNISQSKIKTWRQCRFAYHQKYVKRLRKKRVARPLMFGRMVHEMIEADANGDDPFELLDRIDLTQGKMFRRELEMYGDIIADIRVIMTEYFQYWEEKGPLIYSRRAGRSAEHPFEIEVEPGIRFKGKIDAVAKSKKLRWLTEHKSFTKMPDETERWRSVQSAVYIRALDMLGWWQVDGTLWDYIRSKPPSVPQILKNGGLSRAKKVDTLPSRLRAFIAAQGLKERDYKELIAMAEENRDSYFVRIYSPMKREVVDNTWSDFLDTAREIADKGEVSKPKTVGRHCSWCDFEGLCRAEAQGSDVDFIREREYTVEPEGSLTDERPEEDQ